jgi:hypothetical protein
LANIDAFFHELTGARRAELTRQRHLIAADQQDDKPMVRR